MVTVVPTETWGRSNRVLPLQQGQQMSRSAAFYASSRLLDLKSEATATSVVIKNQHSICGTLSIVV